MSRIERKVIPLHALPASTLMEQFGRLLGDPGSIDAQTRLVPAEHIPALRRELQASIGPAAPREAAKAVAMLIGSFKTAGAVASPDTFARAMTEELAEYPADVLHAAIRHARRGLRWLPSIAEMVELCEAEMQPRRARLQALERVAAEHARRRGEAVAEQRRTAERQARLQTAAAQSAAPPAPEDEPDEWQLAVQALRRQGVSDDEVAAFTLRLMDDDPTVRAQAETQQRTLAAAARQFLDPASSNPPNSRAG